MGKLVSVGINDQAIVVSPDGDPRGFFSYLSWLNTINVMLKDVSTVWDKEPLPKKQLDDTTILKPKLATDSDIR